MNHAQHTEVADLCLYQAAPLVEAGAEVLAAEATWGAAVHVIDAANHARGVNRHAGSNRERRTILRYFEQKYDTESQLSGYFMGAVTNLHNHFYTGRLNDAELRVHLATGRAFVATMFELSARELAAD